MFADPREAYAAQARYMFTHPWDWRMWSTYYGAMIQQAARDPARFYREAIDAQVDYANRWLDWVEQWSGEAS
jgi:hypothetical protein